MSQVINDIMSIYNGGGAALETLKTLNFKNGSFFQELGNQALLTTL